MVSVVDAEEYFTYRTWKGWNAESFGIVEKGQALYFESELARFDSRQLKARRVLEVGFGNGAFAGWAKSEGMDYSGTETIADLVALGRSKGFDMHLGHQSLSAIATADSLDLVIAFDVFEHVPLQDLKVMLAESLVVLKPGGFLFARMPSGDSPFSRSIQHGDLTHCTVLGSSAVAQLAEAVRFEVVLVAEPAFPLRGAGLVSWIRRAAVSAGRRVVFALIAKLLMGGGTPVLTPNMVFVLRKPILVPAPS